MNKYVLVTESESGDDYIYFLQSEERLNGNHKKIKKFLKEDCIDPDYEYIKHFQEIGTEEFRTI